MALLLSSRQPSPTPTFDFSSQVAADVLGDRSLMCFHSFFFFYSLPFPFSDRGLQSPPEGTPTIP